MFGQSPPSCINGGSDTHCPEDIVHGPDRVTVHPPPPPGQSETKFFLLLGHLPISKVDAIQKSWDGLPVLGYFQNGRHHNLEITFCAIT